MSNYPAGVTDNDPHFDLPNANDDEDADDAAEAVLRKCAKCGRPFNYPPSDNKSDATLCAWCDPVLSPQPAPDAEGEWVVIGARVFNGIAGTIAEAVDAPTAARSTR